MITLAPVKLEGYGIRLEPLAHAHQEGLATAAADGRLWELWFTSVPLPEQAAGYITEALEGQRAGHMLPWAVRELATGSIVGSTRYHDIAAQIDRLEIGYLQIAPARARVRGAGVPRRRLSDGQLQPRISNGDLGSRRPEGRSDPPPPGPA